MAERQASRDPARKRRAQPAVRGGRRQAAGAEMAEVAAADAGEPEARIKALEAELATVRFELDSARERIAQLEALRKEALDRIAWVIDSLHSLNRS
jgi:chromosome segregation ATPase